jgi:membrane protease YdiL (CAAX protease family)
MVTALMWAFVVHFSAAKDDGEHTAGTAVVEGLDTVIVVMAALAVGRLRLARPGFWFRAAAWLLAPLAIALVLAVNVGYRWVLIQFLQNQWLEDALSEPEWSTINVLLVAVQPAVVEEWFFRYLALGSLRTATNVHAAVWISAVMFAMAHIYNPLGLPWLFVAGVVFGYARVASGGLAVPILMHFAHNAIILWFRGFV